MFETNDQKKCSKRFKTIQCIKRFELLALFMVLVKRSKLLSMRRSNSTLMNEKRTSDKGQHSCRDAFVLLFICPMNGISFRKRHRVLCPLLIHFFCSSFCKNFFWRILIFHFSPLINSNFNIFHQFKLTTYWYTGQINKNMIASHG